MKVPFGLAALLLLDASIVNAAVLNFRRSPAQTADKPEPYSDKEVVPDPDLEVVRPEKEAVRPERETPIPAGVEVVRPQRDAPFYDGIEVASSPAASSNAAFEAVYGCEGAYEEDSDDEDDSMPQPTQTSVDTQIYELPAPTQDSLAASGGESNPFLDPDSALSSKNRLRRAPTDPTLENFPPGGVAGSDTSALSAVPPLSTPSDSADSDYEYQSSERSSGQNGQSGMYSHKESSTPLTPHTPTHHNTPGDGDVSSDLPNFSGVPEADWHAPPRRLNDPYGSDSSAGGFGGPAGGSGGPAGPDHEEDIYGVSDSNSGTGESDSAPRPSSSSTSIPAPSAGDSDPFTDESLEDCPFGTMDDEQLNEYLRDDYSFDVSSETSAVGPAKTASPMPIDDAESDSEAWV